MNELKEAEQSKVTEFEFQIRAKQLEVYQMAVMKGWWDKPREDGTLIALMHSELSEALEAARHGNKSSEHIPKFSGVEEEMADVVIRIMDFCQARGYRLGEAIEAKVEFNSGRSKMHGGKKF